jgi:predicted DNA-binding transcriptional regulator AlpA
MKYSQEDISKVMPSFKMLVETKIIEPETATEMLQALKLPLLNPSEKVKGKPKLMKRKEVAEYLGVSLVQVDRLANAGMLKKLHIGEHSTRYIEEDVVNFVLNQKI